MKLKPMTEKSLQFLVSDFFFFQIHVIGTIAGVFMPALLPACANLYEVGAYTKDGDQIKKFLVDSPDGLIKIDHNMRAGDNCCEMDVFGFNNDNISIEVKNPYPQPHKLPVHYKLPRYYILQVLIHMVATDCQVNWYACGGPKSVVLIECLLDEELWEDIWGNMKSFLDKAKPVATHWMKQIVRDYKEKFDTYIEEKTSLIGEVPRIDTEENKSEFLRPFTFSPYHKPRQRKNRLGPDLDEVKEMIQAIYLRSTRLIRDSFHIVREEAAEIIAFVASDSSRIPQPGIPCQIPIAYGLKGHSLPMCIMRSMIEDVRDSCLKNKVNIRCEVYDGQFLNLVRYAEDGTPLTRLAFFQQFFKELKKWSKVQCLNYLVTEAIPNGVPLDLLTTPDKVQLWQRNWEDVTRRRERRNPRADVPGLDTEDISNLLRGSQLGRRLSRQIQTEIESDDDENGDDDTNVDPDYIANDSDSEANANSDYSQDESSDLEEELADLITDMEDQQPLGEQTFLDDLLKSLCELKRGKIDWSQLDVDDLVNNYLKKPAECLKMVHDELNLVGNLIQTYTGIKVMNVSDTKPIKINKIVTSLQTSSEELITPTMRRNRVKTLQQIARVKLMDPTYPKVYLQIVIANSLLETAATNWVNKSPISMEINVDADDCGDFFTHTCHSFPEFSERRQQREFRCIDPGHTLANMRSQISRYGFKFCSKAAFVKVSETNHKVLPKSILEDRLDRQSIRIAKRFFSVDVQEELEKNGDHQEAKFVSLVRNWFEACDERGIDAYTRVKHLQDFSDFLAELVTWDDWPPPYNYIQGMPVPTYEAIMQGISTRLQIFALSNMPINQRSISTVAIESFFSEITAMEFSGLGCPKAVDIPRLISHVTELNSIRHDTGRGFVFNTSNRGAYPYDSLEPPIDRNQTRFDLPRVRKKRKAQSLLALPKAITRGQLTIREFHRKDESKVPLHRRSGVPETFDAMDPS